MDFPLQARHKLHPQHTLNVLKRHFFCPWMGFIFVFHFVVGAVEEHQKNRHGFINHFKVRGITCAAKESVRV